MFEIEKVDSPFHIQELPLTKVYVIDNYLETNVWHHLDDAITSASMWSKTNQVNSRSPTGLPHHSFWGASWFRSDENGNRKNDYGVHKPTMRLADSLDRKIQNDFGFVWKRFQYMGTNSQTYGQHGTTHADCDEKDDWNLSFLYYYNRYWNPNWGGKLRFYDSPQQGLDGRDEHIKNHQIGEVDFVPNRLLMFDGRIPHGADAPNERARYQDRRSIVLRGDEVELCLQ
tara:strand:+ start:346 stop:1029 length:684 start_codon:yes stop_codon:yes gene_type:complete